MKKLHRHITIVSIFILIIFYGAKNCVAEEAYNPYPIIFVHGIASSNDMWIAMRDDLRQYFMNGATNYGTEAFKYTNHTSEWNFFPYCDYKNETKHGANDGNNGNIEFIAKKPLKDCIDEVIRAMEKYTTPVPPSERKVIIVCHSMGGLVVRSLLHQMPSYKDKIYRVVFIDTPHLGSPYASALWLLNELEKDAKLKQPYKNTMYHSYSAFSFPALTCADYVDYPLLYHEICNTQTNIDRLLAVVRSGKGPRPEGTAISQLRLPGFSYYEAKYKGFLSTVTIYKSYSGSETFLGEGSLDNPKDYKVIIGKNTSGMQTTLWSLDKILKFSDNFTFPTLSNEMQSIDNAVFIGDGIVTKSSQEGIGAADYSVGGFHVGIADKPDCIKSVLNAIDDAPQIERVYAVPCDWTGRVSSDYYIIIKAKEYLLADLEIESMNLNGKAVDLQDFEDDGHYKPYLKFGKEFLTQRNSDNNIKDRYGNNITLSPGEFYVKAYFPDEPGCGPIPEADRGYYTFNIKLKNPAEKTTTTRILIRKPAVSFTVSPTLIDIEPYYGGDSTMPHAVNIKVSVQKAQAVVGVCEYSDYEPFIILKEGDTPISCQWNGEGNTGDQKNYKIKLSVFPKDIYARPAKGDNEMSLPIFEWNVVRADPTFIQTHRSHSHLAKYDTLRRFEQYGYSINPAYLNETDTALRRTIDSAVSDIVDIEENFVIEKEKITARARALSQNQPPDHSRDRVSTPKAADKALADLIEQLAKAKEIHISAIIEDVNNLARAAFAKKAPSAAPASCVQAE